jgi:filamentous hemagglutinin family protein
MKRSPRLTFFRRCRRASRRLKASLVVVLTLATASAGVQAQGPVGGTVRAGDVRITGQGTSSTRIDQTSERAIIDWRSFGIGAADQVIFQQPSAQSATLNRVTGEQVSVILGRLDANGTVLLINPNGIVFGGGAQVNVGSLIASTANISDANFMSGKLVFDQPGRRGAGILNAGAMSATDGGLVALVAPHVRNDGVIVARLGKVVLGSADTFTIDLYGDALVNLALSDGHAGQLVGLNGEPVTSLVTNTGHIETAGGQTVLMTARHAKNVLDNLVNMSGTIKADSAVQQGGRILLLGEGGHVDVNGTLSAQGTTGGAIEVLGDRVSLGSAASLDASGLSGGGAVHVGGAYQGKGDTYRSTLTTVEAGATLKANAIEQGDAGEVVVWSDGHTQFAGSVEATGGAQRGNGGRLEVSGKGTLDFLGRADASAVGGSGGSLLLDPAYLNIGAEEAGAIMRVLRTGTTTNLQAEVDINVDAPILGGDRLAGGGLNITAGNNININDFIVTHQGAINLNATQGTVNVAPGKAVFAGSSPITVTANGDLHTGAMLTTGSLAIQSIAGSVAIDAFIDGDTGPVSILAARAVDINQPIVNMANGSALTVTAGTDINVNAQVDGRGDVEGGTVTMTAARDLNVNEAIVTNNAEILLTATNGAMSAIAPLVSGSAALTLNARGNLSSGPISAGALTINSSTGSVNVNGVVDTFTRETRISAASDVAINGAILNGQSGAGLNVSAGRDITVSAMVDGRGGVAGGGVTLTAARNLTINDYVLTHNGAINFTAGSGSLSAGKGTFSGTAGITMRAAGTLTTGVISGGSLLAASSGGAINVNGVIDGTTGRVDLTAATDVAVNAAIVNGRSGAAFTATAGRDVFINAMIDGRDGVGGGSVALKAGRHVALNSAVVTNNGGIDITADSGAITMARDTALVSGNAAIGLTARADVRTQGISGGSLTAASTGGSVHIDGLIDGNTGRVDLFAARDVNINAPVLNTRTGAAMNATAGGNINVNAPINGTNGASGGAVNLTASGDLNVNAPIATQNGEIRLSATNGTATIVPTAGLFAGVAPISLNAFGNINTSTLSGGLMNIASRGGSVFVTGLISGSGAMTIGAAGQVDIAGAITNHGAFSPLTITAGTDINVNAAIGRSAPGIPSGSVTLGAAQNIRLNESIVTQDGAISVTATSGAVTTAAGEGLFAGSGAIALQSGQTLSTPTISTTGPVTLRSTAGAVNVDTAIGGTTGAVTIAAATDVNINRAIANPRTDAPLNVTAGGNINVNAAIDGRDTVLTGPGGGVTLTAANNVTLNQNVVSNNSQISVTAQNGAVTAGAGQGLFAGTGAISVTSGATLNTFTTATTGALNLTSTRGDVNLNTAVSDTTGNLAIAAAGTINVNQAITNLKNGSTATLTAGTDINVLAQVDGRSGPAAGGRVTMTAGNDINVVNAIATNNGAIALTATGGSVTLPVGTEVITSIFDVGLNTFLNQITTPMQASIIAGNAPVTVTSGDNFTLTSPIKTTGALTITSTNGNVTTAAPIADETGAVTITGGNGVIVNREIRTDNQDINLNAGAGGILINQIDDKDYTGTSSVNPLSANLTLRSVGNVSILDDKGVATAGVLTIDTRGQILNGSIGNARILGVNDRPSNVFLNADGGIVTFSTGFAGNVEATSSAGSINLTVAHPNRLRITTGTPPALDCTTCDITLISSDAPGTIGPDVVLNAGGSINMPSRFETVTADFTARSGDINLNDIAFVTNTFTGTSGRDINLGSTVWLGPLPGTPGGGPLTLTAGRDITAAATAPIHIGNSQLATFIANRNISLFTVETLGAVSITSNAGNITLNTDIGGHIINGGPFPDFNPSDLGVASFTLSAPSATAAVNTQGIRAQGNVTISTGGTLTAAKQITSVFGSVSIFAAGGATLSAVPIGNVAQVQLPAVPAPVAPPGPKSPLPSAPGAVGNGGPGLPAFAEIAVAAGDQIVGAAATPGAGGGLTVGRAGGGAGAPGGSGGANGRPGLPSGSGVNQPAGGGADDTSSADAAARAHSAVESCKDESGSEGETGLEAVAPKKKTTTDPATQAATCTPKGGGR